MKIKFGWICDLKLDVKSAKVLSISSHWWGLPGHCTNTGFVMAKTDIKVLQGPTWWLFQKPRPNFPWPRPFAPTAGRWDGILHVNSWKFRLTAQLTGWKVGWFCPYKQALRNVRQKRLLRMPKNISAVYRDSEVLYYSKLSTTYILNLTRNIAIKEYIFCGIIYHSPEDIFLNHLWQENQILIVRKLMRKPWDADDSFRRNPWS